MADKDGAVRTELDVVMAEIKGVQDFVDTKIAEGLTPMREEMTRMAESVSEAEKQLKDARRAQVTRMDTNGQLKVREGRFAGLGLPELSIVRAGVGNFRIGGQTLSADHRIFTEAADASKALAETLTIDHVDAWVEHAVKARSLASGLPTGAPAMRRFAQQAESWANLMRGEIFRAMDSTTAGSGDELVPTFEAAQLWMDVNLDTLVLPLLTQVAMPTQPYDWPTQLGDTDWYPITENVQATTSDVATNKVQLDAKGLKTGVPFSDELSEDSIVNFAAELRSSLSRNTAEVIDDVILNADTTTTNNINADGATISASDAGKAQWLLGWDGLRHRFLVDNTSQGTDAAGAVTASDYNQVLLNMDKYGLARRSGEVVFITDVMTRIASLSIAELETTDSGMGSTLSSGELMNIYGTPIVISEQMRLTDDDGKVTDPASDANNDNGTILGLNTSQWFVGFRRGVTFESEREAGKGQTTMYVSFRMALTGRNTASSDKSVAASYNITKTVGA
jgi:HK97 family phage major capsid protein